METLKNLTSFQIQCLLAVIIGVAVRFIIGRRRFNRKGITGMQQYNSYFNGLITTFSEKLLMLGSLILIIGGVILFLAGR